MHWLRGRERPQSQVVPGRRQQIGRLLLRGRRLPEDARDRVRMSGLCSFDVVQLNLPCSRIGRIWVRLGPVRIDDLDLGNVSARTVGRSRERSIHSCGCPPDSFPARSCPQRTRNSPKRAICTSRPHREATARCSCCWSAPVCHYMVLIQDSQCDRPGGPPLGGYLPVRGASTWRPAGCAAGTQPHRATVGI